jgi:ABC-2 type transport system ATP-binding protein
VLEFFSALSGLPRSERKSRGDELLEIVGMSAWADHKIGAYSKGMMQRIGLAQAMMHDPDLILLDEPTDGVDPMGRKDIRDVLLRLKERGISVFINSHLLSELEMISDRVAIIVGGSVAKQGTLEELSLGRGHFELAVAGEIPESVRLLLPADTKITGETLRIDSVEASEIQPVIDLLRHHQMTIRGVRLVRPTLEELFMEAVMQQGGGSRAAGAAIPKRGFAVETH